jgi:hypothetical protein
MQYSIQYKPEYNRIFCIEKDGMLLGKDLQAKWQALLRVLVILLKSFAIIPDQTEYYRKWHVVMKHNIVAYNIYLTIFGGHGAVQCLHGPVLTSYFTKFDDVLKREISHLLAPIHHQFQSNRNKAYTDHCSNIHNTSI